MSTQIFVAAMKQLSLFSGNRNTLKLAKTISEITGIPLWSLQLLERKMSNEISFSPLRSLLDNKQYSDVGRMRYKLGLKQARFVHNQVEHQFANKVLLTIGTERGVIEITIKVLFAYKNGESGPLNQEAIILTEYRIYKGLKTSTFRQKLRVREPALAA